jgi:hypothetical protein
VLFCMKLARVALKDQCFVIRFEDLNRDPVTTLNAIERWCGYSLALAREKLAAGDSFAIGHIVTGNRIRKKRSVRFEPSAASASAERPARARALVWVMERYRKFLGF